MDGVREWRVMLHYVKRFRWRSCPRWLRPSSGPTSSTTTSWPNRPPMPRRPPSCPPSKYRAARPKVNARGRAKTATEAKPGGESADEQADVAGMPACRRQGQGHLREGACWKRTPPPRRPWSRSPLKSPPRSRRQAGRDDRQHCRPNRAVPPSRRAKRPQPSLRLLRCSRLSPPRPAEPAAAGEDRRDANDLARAAIERLRGSETPRAPEAARVRSGGAFPRADLTRSERAAPLAIVKPLPPPIIVCSAARETDAARAAAALRGCRARRRSDPPDAACRNPDRAAAARSARRDDGG